MIIKDIFKVILYKPLYNILIFLAWLVPGHNIGWAIIILTILIRLLFVPSSIKTLISQQKIQKLQPELEKIKEKYKDDKAGQTKAMMAFYSQHKVNPLSSCLPLIVQMVILVILYRVFLVGLDASRFGDLLYGFVPRPEYIKTVFLWFDLTKPDPWILPAMAAGLQFLQAWQMKPKQPAKKEGEPDFASMFSKQMIYMMPVMTLLIGHRLQAALVLYWVITTAFMVVQQWLVVRRFKPGSLGVEVTVKTKS